MGFVGACVAVCLGVVVLGSVLVGKEREMMGVAKGELGKVDGWESFELWPRVAGVSDVMAWVGSRVKRVESFRYLLGSDVRVELVFEAESPTKAREFHDELLNWEVTSWGMVGENIGWCFRYDF